MKRGRRKTIPLDYSGAFVDSAFTTKSSEAHVVIGPIEDHITAEVRLSMEDGFTKHLCVYWKIEHRKHTPDGFELINRHPDSHSDMEFGFDEIEAFATALYLAVQNAKKAGYLSVDTASVTAALQLEPQTA